MSNKDYSVAMKNAEASVCMEGCEVTSRMREKCRRVMDGEVSTGEILRQFAAEKAENEGIF